jgi:hypothetical protein
MLACLQADEYIDRAALSAGLRRADDGMGRYLTAFMRLESWECMVCVISSAPSKGRERLKAAERISSDCNGWHHNCMRPHEASSS